MHWELSVCPRFTFVAVIKQPDTKQLSRERAYFSAVSGYIVCPCVTVTMVSARSSLSIPSLQTRAEKMHECALACADPYFYTLIQFRILFWGNGASHGGLSLPRSTKAIKTVSCRHVHKPTWCRPFLIDVLFQVIPSCVKLSIQIMPHNVKAVISH